MTQDISIELLTSINAIPAADWNTLNFNHSVDLGQSAANATPLLSHAFLSALESSGSVGTGTGWSPRHLIVKRGDISLARYRST